MSSAHHLTPSMASSLLLHLDATPAGVEYIFVRTLSPDARMWTPERRVATRMLTVALSLQGRHPQKRAPRAQPPGRMQPGFAAPPVALLPLQSCRSALPHLCHAGPRLPARIEVGPRCRAEVGRTLRPWCLPHHGHRPVRQGHWPEASRALPSWNTATKPQR